MLFFQYYYLPMYWMRDRQFPHAFHTKIRFHHSSLLRKQLEVWRTRHPFIPHGWWYSLK